MNDLLFLDAETSGLTPRFGADIVEVALVNAAGHQVFHSLAKPHRGIPKSATAIHGITNEMVANAPSSDEVREQVYVRCRDVRVGIYNAAFDVRFLPRLPVLSRETFCMMKLSMERFGARRTLVEAAAHYGIELPQGMVAHRAGADAYLLSRVHQAMQAEKQVAVSSGMKVNGVTLEIYRNREFKYWGEVPSGLKTRTQLKSEGLQPGGVMFAQVKITRGTRYRIGSYALFKLSEAIPLKS